MTKADSSETRLVRLFAMIRSNRVYWIIPLALTLLLAVLALVGRQSSAPFVYTLF